MSYAIRNDGKGWRAVNGPEDLTADENFSMTQPPTPTPNLAEHKRQKILDIDIAVADAIAPITSVYSQAERDTWPIQEAEAVAWTANSNAATPMLNAIATARSETIAAVAANVLTKAAAFKILAGTTFGKRKAKMDLIDAAATAADLSEITW